MLETEFQNADDSPGLLLWRVTNSWQAAQRVALAQFGLTHVQFVLLASVTRLELDAPTTQRDVADLAGTDPAMTSQVLRTLETKGLVERLSHPTDTRAKSLRVTPAGRDLANSAIAVVEATDKTFFAPLGSRSPTFTAALQKLDRTRQRR